MERQTMKMNRGLLVALAMALAVCLGACGGDDDGGGSDTGSSKSGSSSGDSGSNSSSSSSSCSTDHLCINGSCECKTAGKEGQSCCSPDDCGADDATNCRNACEVCD